MYGDFVKLARLEPVINKLQLDLGSIVWQQTRFESIHHIIVTGRDSSRVILNVNLFTPNIVLEHEETQRIPWFMILAHLVDLSYPVNMLNCSKSMEPFVMLGFQLFEERFK